MLFSTTLTLDRRFYLQDGGATKILLADIRAAYKAGKSPASLQSLKRAHSMPAPESEGKMPIMTSFTGKPAAKARRVAKTGAKTGEKTEAKAKAKAKAKTKAKTKAKADVKAKAKTGAGAEAKTTAKAKAPATAKANGGAKEGAPPSYTAEQERTWAKNDSKG